MPLPTDKPTLLHNLTNAYQKLDAEFDSVPEAMARQTELEGHISCCDLIAYQIGWAETIMNWEITEQQGKTVIMPAEGFKWNQLGELASHFYQRYADQTLPELRQQFAQQQNQLIDWINPLDETELFVPHQRQWTGDKWAMVKWIQVNTIAPYQSARTKLRRWKKQHNLALS